MEKQASNETVKRAKSHLSCSVPKDYITKYLNILLFRFRISVKANYSISSKSTSNTSSNYLLKVNNRNTWTRRKTRSKLTIRISERRQWRRFGVFIVNLRPISHLVLVFLLILNLKLPAGNVIAFKCYWMLSSSVSLKIIVMSADILGETSMCFVIQKTLLVISSKFKTNYFLQHF